MDAPDTQEPDEREKIIAMKYNKMVSERKFSAFWIDAPTKASTGNTTTPSSPSITFTQADVGRW